MIRPDWRTVLAALLIVLAFPPWDLQLLIWVCLVPWFFALARTRTTGEAIAQGVWLSILMSVGGFYWVASVLKEFGGLPWPLAAVGLLAYSFIGQPQFYLFAPLYRRLIERPLPGQPVLSYTLTALLLALFYSGLDWMLPKLFVDTLGHSFYSQPSLRQVADLGGAPLLTFLALIVNHALFSLLHRLRNRGEPSAWPAIRTSMPEFLFAALALAAAWLYGDHRRKQIETVMSQPLAHVNMAVVQANIGDFDKVAAESGYRETAHRILNTYYHLSDQALTLSPRPDVIVWPETSYPSTFRTPGTTDELARDQALEAWTQSRGVPLLFGGYDQERGKDFNAFFYLTPAPIITPQGQSDLQVYRKNILLLFGEYIPFMENIKFLKEAFPQIGNFGRGAGPEVLQVPAPKVPGGMLKTGPVICYEALFPNYVLEAARKGSQVIVNITNDSWFGPHGEPHLHLALTVFRSIESRLPQLRATNTGISALILPNGEITQSTPLFQPALLNAAVPIIKPHPTLMLAWGDWFGLSSFIIGALGLAANIVFNSRQQTQR